MKVGRDSLTTSLIGLPDGSYRVAYGSRGLNTIEVQSIQIEPGQTKTVCINLASSGETCIEVKNTDTKTIKLTPSYFSALSECDKLFGDRRPWRAGILRRGGSLTPNGGGDFALNPDSVFFAKWTIKAKVDLSKQVVDVIKSKNGKVTTIGTQGGKAVATGPGRFYWLRKAREVLPNDGNSRFPKDAGTVVFPTLATL